MPTPYEKQFHIPASAVDCFDRLKPSHILDYMQEVAGDHSTMLGQSRQALTQRGLFWAVIRHKVQITRLPKAGENITVKTWPMPTTRTAYPRSTIIYDEQGKECLRSISLWVLMDKETRAMVLPGKSGVDVPGIVRGLEADTPGSITPKPMENSRLHTVGYALLDRNGHMNNTRYLDWVDDLLPSAFHKEHPVREFSVSYHAEAREGQQLQLSWDLAEGPVLQVDAHREKTDVPGEKERVFSAKIEF